MSVSSASAVTLLGEVKEEHAAQTARIAKLEAEVLAGAKAEAKAAGKKAKKEAKAAAKAAGEPVEEKPRECWPAWTFGDPHPADGGEAVPAAKDRYPDAYDAFVKPLSSLRGAAVNFASEASKACEGDPVGEPKPVAEEGEEEDAYEARLVTWRDTMAAKWHVDAKGDYAEHVARYKAMSEARSGDGSSSKSKRVKLTEEEKLANREARKAATKEKNEAKKAAEKAEKEAAKAAKAAGAKPKPAPPKVKNAAVGGAGKPSAPSKTPSPASSTPAKVSKAPVSKAPASKGKVTLGAADSDSSDSSDSSDDDAPPSPPPSKGKKPAAAPAAPLKAKPAASAEPEKPLETLKLVTVKGHGKVLQTSDRFLFKTTEEAGVPGDFIGLLEKDGSVNKDVENPFDAV